MSDSGSTDVPRFGARKVAQRLQGELQQAQRELAAVSTALAALDGLSLADVETKKAAAVDDLTALQAELDGLRREVALAKQQIVDTEDQAILQEVGIYSYRHPLTDAVAYQTALKDLQSRIKSMARSDGGAVTGATNWTVNGSLPQGRKMVKETSKLMLRAYNAEADNLVRGLKPYKRDAAIERLGKTLATIAKLGKTMSVEVTNGYHQLRVREIELTADYLMKKDEEREREREEKQRLREEREAQREMERERARLEKEQAHYRNALAALEAAGDAEAAARLREQLADVDKAIADVDYRAANIRAGYVYVISNIGAFGPEVVKIGMTRRLDPQDRVRELGDASVPFRYDTHALFFAEDAVSIEAALHRTFDAQRINKVNQRREFFRVTPLQVKAALAELAGELLEFTETPEAVEYRQSLHSQA